MLLNPKMNFNLMNIIIFPIFNEHKTQNKIKFFYFKVLQKLGCYTVTLFFYYYLYYFLK